MYRTFGDVFAYRTSGSYCYTKDTRWFHDCILLKDIGAEHVHAGSVVDNIQVISGGRIWLSIDHIGMVYEFVDMCLPTISYDQIITDIKRNMEYADVETLIAFDTQRDLEDFYGVIFGDRRTKKIISMSACKNLSARCSSREKIVTAFKRAISDPSYQMCRDRLMREAAECIF